MKKAVLFDLDGTLLDTLDDIRAAVNVALGARGFPPRSREEVRAFVGNGMGLLARRAVPAGTSPEETRAVLETLAPYYAAHCREKTRPYPGVTEILDTLKARGTGVAVVSNKPDGAVAELCRAFFPQADFTWGDRPGLQRKPAPDGLLAALEALGARREEAVYVGDSEVDVTTARNAGVDAVLVTWGFRDRPELLAAGAKTLADTPEELLALLS